METQYALVQLAMIVIAGVLAVGAVLLIKITRRRQAARGLSNPALPTGVPTRPMSREHADRLLRRYLWSVATVLTLLAVGVLIVLLR